MIDLPSLTVRYPVIENQTSDYVSAIFYFIKITDNLQFDKIKLSILEMIGQFLIHGYLAIKSSK